MNAKQKRRLSMIASIVLVAGAAGWLILGNFQESLVYFYTPTEVLAQSEALEGRKIRLAGQVEMGSLVQSEDKLDLTFKVTDGTNAYPVSYRGIVPDLFAEGQMAIAEGRIQGNAFKAEQIMAKHSEDYNPDQMAYPHMNKEAEKW